jgi:hypothetical protein
MTSAVLKTTGNSGNLTSVSSRQLGIINKFRTLIQLGIASWELGPLSTAPN